MLSPLSMKCSFIFSICTLTNFPCLSLFFIYLFFFGGFFAHIVSLVITIISNQPTQFIQSNRAERKCLIEKTKQHRQLRKIWKFLFAAALLWSTIKRKENTFFRFAKDCIKSYKVNSVTCNNKLKNKQIILFLWGKTFINIFFWWIIIIIHRLTIVIIKIKTKSSRLA